MNDRDFSLESDWLDHTAPPGSSPPSGTAQAEKSGPAEPVVVVQYRNRGVSPFLLFPLLLICSLALFAGYHHYVVAPMAAQEVELAARRLVAASERSSNLSTPEIDAAIAQVSALPPAAADFPAPLTLEGQPAPLGIHLDSILTQPSTPRPAAAEAPAAPGAAFAWPGGQPVGEVEKPAAPAAAPAEPLKAVSEPAASAGPRERPASISIASTGPKSSPTPPAAEEPTPTREEMMERIRQESELQQAQREELERRKQEAVARFEAENTERVENERVQFHQALSNIVSSGRRDAGRAVDELCDQFGRGYSQDMKNQVFAALSHYKGKLTRDGEIRMLRNMGVPEPGILDYLCNRAHRSIRSRNGPSGPDEVRLLAARQLLMVPPGSSDKKAPSGTPPTRPSTIRRTNSPARR